MIALNVSKSPKSTWEAQKAKLKLKFPKLTEADLNFDETKQEEMLKALEPKLAITPEELKLLMETL